MRLSEIHRAASVHYVTRIFIGTVIIEALAHEIHSLNPLWAIISLVVVTDPLMKTAWTTFVARFVNTILGCAIGILFLSFGTPHSGLMTLGISMSALCSSYLAKLQQGWRIGPVTTALIMSAGLTEARADAFHLAIERTLAILLGSIIALLITASLSKVWVPPEEKKGK